jgi:hypothetical protein
MRNTFAPKGDTMGTTKQVAAKVTAKATETLVINIEAIPADKQDWKPLDAGRSALSQIQECAIVGPFFAAILRDKAVPEMKDGEYEAACAKLDTVEKAVAALREGTGKLVAAIEAFPEDCLGDTIRMPFGPGFDATFEEIMFMAYWNMTYHEGQLAYIQTLYGDRDMHGKI